MVRNALLTIVVGLLLGCQAAWAQSAAYHLERLQIQSRVFLDTLEPVGPPIGESTTSVAERLDLSTSNSHWSRQMVLDDVQKILETSEDLSQQFSEQARPDELLAAKSTLESLARRLRVSSAAVTLAPQSRTSLDFLLLELEESTKALDLERQQILAQQRVRRARMSLDGDFGYGFGYWGAPLGWGTYYPYGNAFGPGPFYSGFPPAYGVGPGCR